MRKKSTKITVIIEKMDTNYSAYIAEYSGCIATGKTEEEVTNNLINAFKFHLEGLALEGEDYKPQAKIQKYNIPVCV